MFHNYLSGHRSAIYNVKVAGGIFEQDKWLALVTAFSNLSISILGAKYLGLPGVYVGTVLTGLIETFVRPSIVYRELFQVRVWEYYRNGLQYLGVVLFSGMLCWGLQRVILPMERMQATVGVTILARAREIGLPFLGLSICTMLIPNLIF